MLISISFLLRNIFLLNQELLDLDLHAFNCGFQLRSLVRRDGASNHRTRDTASTSEGNLTVNREGGNQASELKIIKNKIRTQSKLKLTLEQRRMEHSCPRIKEEDARESRLARHRRP
jgi:hypothetical protein